MFAEYHAKELPARDTGHVRRIPFRGRQQKKTWRSSLM